ncbi:hypothetical protein [Paenibacillus lactis]|uniref:hypothetical protein n=1 Tax=Paenibacillus lactis TaxID=228574 RepID=UPI001B29856F|nr:hypothetical protein [Paenibacillus lactis]GIO90242.1 hypothetical protein J31TS3_14690 [Paenibacillus lactis]
MEFIGIGFLLVGVIALVLAVRYAIDTSKMITRMDAMLQEMRLLRKDIRELKDNKHIVDKKV